jgi:hypothetical protein
MRNAMQPYHHETDGDRFTIQTNSAKVAEHERRVKGDPLWDVHYAVP